MDILFQNYSLLDPLIPVMALVCASMTRKFTYIWPAVLIAATIIPLIVITVTIVNKGHIDFLFNDAHLQEKLQQMLILRLVVSSFWALFFWWGANRLRDSLKQTQKK